jgi:hypothetical protein
VPLYFLLFDAQVFHEQIVPPLAAAWRQRSIAPCVPLAKRLLPAIDALRSEYFAGPEALLLTRVPDGLAFERRYWRQLAGEVLVAAAAEMPEIQTVPETLYCLLEGGTRPIDRVRERFIPIEQIHFGSRDVAIGDAVYRPDCAGLNDLADVRRLAGYLPSIEPATWKLEDLAALSEIAEEDRQEELDFAREWFEPLRELYRRAAEQEQVIICEQI